MQEQIKKPFQIGDIVKYILKQNTLIHNALAKITFVKTYSNDVFIYDIKWLNVSETILKNSFRDINNCESGFSHACFTLYKKFVRDKNKICRNYK